jgi:hypothetical protein
MWYDTQGMNEHQHRSNQTVQCGGAESVSVHATSSWPDVSQKDRCTNVLKRGRPFITHSASCCGLRNLRVLWRMPRIGTHEDRQGSRKYDGQDYRTVLAIIKIPRLAIHLCSETEQVRGPVRPSCLRTAVGRRHRGRPGRVLEKT